MILSERGLRDTLAAIERGRQELRSIAAVLDILEMSIKAQLEQLKTMDRDLK